jgi:ribosome recycling factor
MVKFDAAQQKLQEAVDHFQADLKKLRAGRPSPEMFEQIPVEAYGSMSTMTAVGNISIVDASLVTIQVWDKSVIPNAVKALQAPEYSYNPQVTDTLIRIPISPMTLEKRQEVVKQLKESAEKYKIQVRMVRKDVVNYIDEQKKLGLLTEDLHSTQEKKLQEMVDKANKDIDELSRQKEDSLLKV